MGEPASTRTDEAHQQPPGTPVEGTPTLPTADDAATPQLNRRAPAPGLPEVFGRYRILRQLGRGGMGTVYLAHDTQIDRPVALKVPHAHVAQDAAVLERFSREARAAGRLHHPNICPVYDVGAIDGVHYLTMAFIEGQPLAAVLVAYQAQPERAAELVRKIALAMAEAHARGIIHRDLKPSNVMIDRRGEPVVMDFGLARNIDPDAATRTSQGVILGTPHYMSPEQANGDAAAVGPASDVFSLGVILYELLCGRLPFEGSLTSILVQIVHSDPPTPSSYRPDLDPRLEAVCLKAMARDPSLRYKSMAELADALKTFLEAGPAPAAPASPVAKASPLPPGMAEESLTLLRTWGWHRGTELLRERLPTGGDALGRLLGWLGGGDADLSAEAARLFPEGGPPADLAAWAAMGRAYRALSAYDFGAAAAHLDRIAAARHAPAERAETDPVLEANLCHVRGFLLFRRGQWEEAVPLLHRALTILGRDHFLTGRLLDTLGEVYAGMNNFHAAREFHEQAMLCKQRFGDEAGIGFSHCRLGRLCIEWGLLDRAEEHLTADLRLVQKSGQTDLEAQVMEYLAKVATERGHREAAAGRRTAATRQWAQAAEWLDWSSAQHRQAGNTVLEGLALNQLAEVALSANDLKAAEAILHQAAPLLAASSSGGYSRGFAEYQRVLGVLRRAQGRYPEALECFQHALAQFDATRKMAAAASTQLDIARTRLAAKAMPRMVTQAFLDALQRAEDCRRTGLVQTAEEELQAVDVEAHARHVFRRVRGPLAPPETSALTTGSSEQASVLFLNLQGFMPFCQGMDPEEVVQTLNQMLADLETVLVRYKAQVTAYLGGGFMALVLGAGHAERAVEASLDLFRVVEEFNRPREVLGLRLLPVRIGVASGSVYLGDIGTYRKMDFTAVGPVVNLASRLVRQGEEASPCISQETFELVQTRFRFKADGPRTLDLKGIGRRQVWDVVGRVKDRPSGATRV